MNADLIGVTFPSRPSGKIAITNVTVIPMRGSTRSVPHQTVVIDGDVIAAIGHAGDFSTVGMRVIDGKGRFLIPGLFDMYTHFREPTEAPLYLASGVTSVRVGGTPEQLAMERLIDGGAFPGPRMCTISPSVDGVRPDGRTDLPGAISLRNETEAESVVTDLVRRGYRQIKAFSLLTPSLLAALGAACDRHGVRLVGNCPNATTMEEASALGMSCFEQLHMVARGHQSPDAPMPTYWDRFDPAPGTHLDFDKIRQLAQLLAERQVWSVPTLVFHHRGSRPPEDFTNDPTFRYVRPAVEQDWEATIGRWADRANVPVTDWRRLAAKRAAAFNRVVGIFHEEGAPLMTGTDSLNPYNVQGDALHEELRLFRAAGMSAYDALLCATAEPARFLGLADQRGGVAVGMHADLVLLGADPSQNLDALARIEAVAMNGYLFEASDLRRLLDERAQHVRQPPHLPKVTLEAVDHGGEVVAAGTWSEEILGEQYGVVAYRLSRAANARMHLLEVHVGANPRRHLERRTSRMELGPRYELLKAEVTTESFAGIESLYVYATAQGRYHARARAVDGYESSERVEGRAAIPIDRLCISALPLWLSLPDSDINGTEFSLISLGDGLAVASGHISVSEHDKRERRYLVSAELRERRLSQTYRFSSEGALLTMEEELPLRWTRKLEALLSHDDPQSS